jgi:hypothetical protein
MHPALHANQFFVKEQRGILQAANNYDILDPHTGLLVPQCREPELGLLSRLLRFTDYKQMTPFAVEIRTPQGQRVLSVRRGTTRSAC